MDIIDIIVRDHDAVFGLIEAMKRTLEPESFRRATAKQQAHAIVTELQIHARA